MELARKEAHIARQHVGFHIMDGKMQIRAIRRAGKKYLKAELSAGMGARIYALRPCI